MEHVSDAYACSTTKGLGQIRRNVGDGICHECSEHGEFADTWEASSRQLAASWLACDYLSSTGTRLDRQFTEPPPPPPPLSSRHAYAMKGYHIRIVLSSPVAALGPPSQATSKSYKQPLSALNASPTFVPISLFQPLPSHPQRSAYRRNTLSTYSSSSAPPIQSLSHRDYRFGPIRVDWVDFADMEASGSGFVTVGSGKEREKSAQRKGVHVFLAWKYD